MPRLARLTVLVPERHDLALMKTVRGDQAAFAKVQAIHDRKPFDLSALRGGDGPRGDRTPAAAGNFLALVGSLFREAVTFVKKALERPDQRTSCGREARTASSFAISSRVFLASSRTASSLRS